ncbi:MAG: hypothetical protein JNK48_01605 [Bryobacterales bacterium]|nr:hypothetical protein [Bryobacterales bacterium]
MNDDELLKKLRGMKMPAGPEADLWDRVQHRIAEAPARFSAWDWAIAAAAAAVFLLYPELAAALLYHL